MDFTKASLSGQQFREKRGVRGESIQRACHAVSSGQTFSAEREDAVVFGSSLLCGWHTCGHAAAIQINSGALLFLVGGGHGVYNL